MSARTTISDVAAQAGVSISTVSLVMNGKGAVATSTRQRVRTVAERLGYTPSRSARGLAAGRTGNVGFVLREDHFRRSEPFYTRVFLGAEFEARRRGLYVLLATIPDAFEAALHTPRFLNEHSVDGVVVAGGVDDAFLSVLERSRIPFVLADYAWPGATSVELDNEGGAALVAAHLTERGHRAIGFVGADPHHPSLRARESGFAAALAAAGHPLDSARVAVGDGSSDRRSGADLAGRLLDRPDRPTAVFCANDALALGFVEAAHARGLHVPGDVAVVGFDDVEAAAVATPPLTTVRVFKEQLGEVALGLLAEQVAGAQSEGLPAAFERTASTTRIATDLVVRSSG